MTRTNIHILGASFGMFALVAASDGLAQTRRVEGSCHSIRVSAPDAPDSHKRRRSRRTPSFSASEILDLEFEVALPPSTNGDHRLELKLYTPKDHLYQTLSAPFAVDGGSSDSTKVSRRRRRRFLTATATLPVAGTTIVMSSLYGEWEAEAYLDGSQVPCTRSRKFVIQP